jgi:hypothetical protein
MPCASAATFTAEAWSCRPRPAGRSGAVTTATTCPPGQASRLSSVDTAKSGVPMKMIRSIASVR